MTCVYSIIVLYKSTMYTIIIDLAIIDHMHNILYIKQVVCICMYMHIYIHFITCAWEN